MCVLQGDRVNSLLSSKYLKVFVSAPRKPLEPCTGLVSPLLSRSDICFCHPSAQTPLCGGYPRLQTQALHTLSRFSLSEWGHRLKCRWTGASWSQPRLLRDPSPWVRRHRRGGVGPSHPGWRGPCLHWEMPCPSDSSHASQGHPQPKRGTVSCPAWPEASGAHPDLRKAMILHQIHSWNRNDLKAPAFQVPLLSFIKIVAMQPVGWFPVRVGFSPPRKCNSLQNHQPLGLTCRRTSCFSSFGSSSLEVHLEWSRSHVEPVSHFPSEERGIWSAFC